MKYAMEKCSIQLENHKARLETLLGYRSACEAGIRAAVHTRNSRAHIREYQLLLLHLEQEIDTQKTQLAMSQQTLEQYQARLRALHGNNQLNEMKAAIKSVELRQQQVVSAGLKKTSNMNALHVMDVARHQYHNELRMALSDVKK